MPNSRYQIQYRDKSGAKHTVKDVTNTKDVIGPLEGEGATDFVVLKQDANGKAEAPQTPTGKAALSKMNGSTSEPSGPADDSNDAAGAGDSAPVDASSAAEDAAETPVEANTPALKKKGAVPAGLAAYLAKKAAAKKS